jgi:hypothetical protein
MKEAVETGRGLVIQEKAARMFGAAITNARKNKKLQSDVPPLLPARSQELKVLSHSSIQSSPLQTLASYQSQTTGLAPIQIVRDEVANTSGNQTISESFGDRVQETGISFENEERYEGEDDNMFIPQPGVYQLYRNWNKVIVVCGRISRKWYKEFTQAHPRLRPLDVLFENAGEEFFTRRGVYIEDVEVTQPFGGHITIIETLYHEANFTRLFAHTYGARRLEDNDAHFPDLGVHPDPSNHKRLFVICKVDVLLLRTFEIWKVVHHYEPGFESFLPQAFEECLSL